MPRIRGDRTGPDRPERRPSAVSIRAFRICALSARAMISWPLPERHRPEKPPKADTSERRMAPERNISAPKRLRSGSVVERRFGFEVVQQCVAVPELFEEDDALPGVEDFGGGRLEERWRA